MQGLHLAGYTRLLVGADPVIVWGMKNVLNMLIVFLDCKRVLCFLSVHETNSVAAGERLAQAVQGRIFYLRPKP